jgi:hypothetical protein
MHHSTARYSPAQPSPAQPSAAQRLTWATWVRSTGRVPMPIALSDRAQAAPPPVVVAVVVRCWGPSPTNKAGGDHVPCACARAWRMGMAPPAVEPACAVASSSSITACSTSLVNMLDRGAVMRAWRGPGRAAVKAVVPPAPPSDPSSPSVRAQSERGVTTQGGARFQLSILSRRKSVSASFFFF